MVRSRARIYGLVAIVLAVIGAVFLVVGVLYLLLDASALPGFFPGHIPYSHFRHTQRGIGGVVLAGVCFLLAAVAWWAQRARVRTRWMR